MLSHEALLATFGEALLRELLHVVRWYEAPTLGPIPRISSTLARALIKTAKDMGIDLNALESHVFDPPPREEKTDAT